MSKRSLSFFIFLLWSTLFLTRGLFAQGFQVNAHYHYGVLLPEYSIVSMLSNDYLRGLDVTLYKTKTGRDLFEQIYNYPDIGFAFFASSLGNREILGQAYGANCFFRLHMLRKKRVQLYNRTGIGLAYITKKWSLKSNPMNVVIGSHINIHFNVRLGANVNLGERLSLNGGLSFDHYSNGNTSEPNIGLNYLSLYGGASYRFGQEQDFIVSKIPKHDPHFSKEGFISFGGKHTRSFSSNYYFTMSTAFEFHYKLRRAFHLGLGVDGFFDSSIRSQMAANDLSFKPHYSYQTGIHFSQTFAYRKFRFTLQEGIYVGLINQLHRRPMYNRGILNYAVTDRISVRLTMKSHLHILDYPEIGFGCTF